MKYLLLIFSLFIARFHVVAQNLELESILPYEREMSDIWGWSDGAKEYALVATTHYFSIVDVTDPENPVKLHQIEGPTGGPGSYWREMRTYGNYAYGVHDFTNLGGDRHGLVIVDLSDLPAEPDVIFWQNDNASSIPNFSRAHNIFIDEFGYAYIVGHNFDNGGVLILDLKGDPLNPTIVGRYDDHYVHDIFVRDNIMYTAEINDDEFAIIDASDKSNLTEIARQGTPFGSTHHVWLSDDDNTLFTAGETGSAPIASYNIKDPADIKILDTYRSGAGTIPHNVFVLNDFLFGSVYTDGVVLLDVTLPDEMVEMGRYDTAPGFSGGGFNGCWGVYPYLPSGIVLATDIENGLHIFSPTYVRATHVRGKVIDGITGNEIFGADVTITQNNINNINLSTNFDGDFKKGYVEPGSFKITVSKSDYSIFDTTITLASGDIYDEIIELISPNINYLDTIYTELFTSNQVEICDVNSNGVNPDSIYTCDGLLINDFGSISLGNNGCINYSSNNIGGVYIDTLCFTIKDFTTGSTNSNYVVVSIIDTTATSINDYFLTGALQLLQNPVDKTLNLKNSIVIRAPLTLSVFNMSGQQVQNTIREGQSSLIQMDVDELSSGIYVLKVMSDQQILGITKFVKD